jgi:hypothetical protein
MPDSGPVEIAPLTLLVGQNSSGKSTLARIFPLLRQSSESFAREPILWFGRLADFGSADIATCRQNPGEPCGLDVVFEINESLLSYPRRAIGSIRKTHLAPVKLSIRYIPSGGTKFSYKFSLSFFNHEISIDIKDSFVLRISINNKDYSDHLKDLLFVESWQGCFPSISYRDDFLGLDYRGVFRKRISEFARINTHRRTESYRRGKLVSSICSAPLHNLLQALRNIPEADSVWKRNTEDWEKDSPQLKEITELVIGNRLIEVIQEARLAFNRHCQRVTYITPVRASAQRYYRRQGLALREIDSQGENVAMIIDSMSNSERKELAEWMEGFFGCYVATASSQGHISMTISRSSNLGEEFSYNLADTGFGFSQMIPILLQLWLQCKKRRQHERPSLYGDLRVVVIEQPELHLHPRLQSKLADLFLSMLNISKQNKIRLRIIIETHSEHIINRIGALIGQSGADREDVNIVIFEKSDFSSATSVRSTSYDDDGLIDNWPYGFFDSGDA